MSEPKQFKLAGIIGMPVFQSRSPIIYNHWIKKHGILGAYGHFPVQIENIEAAIRGMRALGIAGGNITQPHKLLAMPLMDSIDPMAEKIGAINCIVRRADGSLHGFNSDWIGYITSLKVAKPGWRADEGPITVLGAGGAARAVLFGLIHEGAKEIRLLNRTLATAQELASIAPHIVKAYDWEERHSALDGCAMLINSTNQGMYGQPPLDIHLDALPKTAIVSDLIYIPLETPLLEAARLRGNLTVNGLEMLLHQAVPAFESWFDIKPEVTPELRQEVLNTFK